MGFSLVEMLMTLSLLTVVSIPMVMMLHQQKLETDKSRNQTQANTIIAKLFDAINFKDINAVSNYQQSEQISIYCDSKIPGNSSSGKDCSTTLPLFTRNLSFDSAKNTLTATVDLYYSLNSLIPDYTFTRVYTPYQNYRTYTIPITTTVSASSIIDSNNEVWSKEFFNEAELNPNLPEQTTSTSNCPSSTSTVSGPSPYFLTARNIVPNCSVEYYFQVLPNKRYAVKVYFSGANATDYRPTVEICTETTLPATGDTCANYIGSGWTSSPIYEKVNESYPLSNDKKTYNIRQYIISSDNSPVLHVSVAPAPASTSPAISASPTVQVTAVEVLQL